MDNNEKELNNCTHPLLYCFGKWTKTYWEINKKYIELESRLYYMGIPNSLIEKELMRNGITRHNMIQEGMYECKCLYCNKQLSLEEKEINPSKIINYSHIGDSSEEEYNYLVNYLKEQKMNLNNKKANKILKKTYKNLKKD